MSESILFGNRESFGIELGFSKTPRKYKLCLWVQKKRIGSFTKSGELKYFIKAINIFIAHKDEFYLPVFETKTPSQIVQFLVNDLFALGKSNKKENHDEYELRLKFYLFLGFQFSNDGSSIILLYRNNIVQFIYNPPKKATAEDYAILFVDFSNVYNEFINYCIANSYQ